MAHGRRVGQKQKNGGRDGKTKHECLQLQTIWFKLNFFKSYVSDNSTVFELMGGLGGFNPPSSSDPTIVTPPTSQVLGLLAVLLTPPVHFSQFEHCNSMKLARTWIGPTLISMVEFLSRISWLTFVQEMPNNAVQ